MSGQAHQPGMKTGAARRMRRFRARRKAGDRWVPGFDVRREVLERLVDEGWTSEAEANDPQRLSDAVADFLDCWVNGMLGADTRRSPSGASQ